MKKLTFLFFFLFSVAAAMAQTSATPPEPLQFKEVEYDFGSVPQGKPVYHFFEIKNTGSKPITLNDVHASCGCTTPEWSKDPIAPGATAKIKVGFNAASEGAFEKFISIQYNESVQKQIKIRGNVWRAPAGAAPPNAVVQFLKQQLP
jgi:Protein of unknown function (DUF1573)